MKKNKDTISKASFFSFYWLKKEEKDFVLYLISQEEKIQAVKYLFSLVNSQSYKKKPTDRILYNCKKYIDNLTESFERT